jgi:hypothetical protein
MRTSDYFGFGFSYAFGLCFMLMPQSAVRFYSWFHRRDPGNTPTNARWAGAFWIGLTAIVNLATIYKLRE